MRSWRLGKYFCDPDVAIDVGTANTRLYVLDRGIVADEPTRCGASQENSLDEGQSEIDAKPLSGGVVRDIDATAQLLGRLLKRARRWGRIRSRALVCAPSDASRDERLNLTEAVRRTGIARVKLLPEPLASAVGAGLDITSPYSQMLVDIGDGITDVAVISSRALVATRAVRRAGCDLRSALQRWVKRRTDLFLPASEADRLIREHGALGETCALSRFSILAFDRAAAPVRLDVRREEVFEAISPVLGEIVGAVCSVMRALPADSAVEVVESGIRLCGGGACLRGIDRLIARETHIEVKITTNPMHATIEGAGEILSAAREADLWETDWNSSPGFDA